MKFVIIEEENDSTYEIERMRAIIRSSSEDVCNEDIRVVLNLVEKRARMNIFQLLKLWRMCGNYDVPFREDDYVVHSKPSVFVDELGTVEGWVGGNLHNGHNNMRQTIYVGVLPDGSSYT